MPYTELSKTISHALRHQPQQYGLMLEENGWIELDILLEAIALSNPKFAGTTTEMIQEIIDTSEKKRFEIQNGKIRALYGHSIPQNIVYETAEPPEILFHATSIEAWSKIQKTGLQSMGRQYVHLTSDQLLAIEAGKRKGKNIVLLKIQAKKANENGVKLYNPSPIIWLAKAVPAEYIHQNS